MSETAAAATQRDTFNSFLLAIERENASINVNVPNALYSHDVSHFGAQSTADILSEITSLRAQRDSLVEALKPWNVIVDDALRTLPSDYLDDRKVILECSWGSLHRVTIGDLRKARDATEEM